MNAETAKLPVALMVAGLRQSLCKKEIAESREDSRFKFFKIEDNSRRSKQIFSEEEKRLRSGKRNRVQIRELLGTKLYCELKKQGIPKLEKPTAVALELLGCDIPSFFLHTERQFKPGMGWHNFGKWHMDHIVACSHFDFRLESNLKTCFHFSNIQPLWAMHNLIKGDKICETVPTY